MIKEFFMKQMLKNQMKGVPPEQQEKILKMVTENPKFFETIATEVQAKMKGGKDQTAAVMEVVAKHKDELAKLMGGMK
ncbi:MAG: hypothetical protein V4674_00530 [Patescibacteria group bacterium]